MVRFLGIVASAFFASTVLSADTVSCSQSNQCPQSQPCCSPYGQCGVGAYCLGGCDPRSSYNMQSCMPRPTCKSSNFKMDSLDDVQQNTYYLGNASNVNWVSSGVPAVYQDTILLTMTQGSDGTLLSSSHYVWYGKISVTMKTSQGGGVVTAFVMMSDVKDEIDCEFVGADVQHVQSNFYWQGTLNYTNEVNLTAANTESQWHTYTLDWQPDQLTWSVDGNVLRTLTRASTMNSTTNNAQYPQTPSRVQLSLWPAGESSEAPGTVAWAGGEIDWDSSYMGNGYYYAQIKEVDVQCYDPPSDAKVSGSNAYVYTDNSGLEGSVGITNDNTILSSFFATGNNPKDDPDAKTASSSGSAPTASLQTVPGEDGTGSRGDGSNTGSDTGSSSSSAGPANPTTFVQGDDGTSSSSSSSSKSGAAASAKRPESALQGSAFAVLVALFALMVL